MGNQYIYVISKGLKQKTDLPRVTISHHVVKSSGQFSNLSAVFVTCFTLKHFLYLIPIFHTPLVFL